MRIKSFRIENYRNLKLAVADDLPDFVVICGGNGSGKSAILEALITAKEAFAAYGGFDVDARAVSVDAAKATISLTLQFSDDERSFCLKTFGEALPPAHNIVVEISRSGALNVPGGRPSAIGRMLSHYSRSVDQPGFFDYINAHRQVSKQQLQNWDASYLSDQRAKETLSNNQGKFQQTKSYLAGLKFRDLQELETSVIAGTPPSNTSFGAIRSVFDKFFNPLRFKDVFISTTPFSFLVSTPRGDVDIDDLSSGEKEILNMFVRFDQLKPRGAVILFDEADAHLHPDLERRYLITLKEMAKGNQLILTTHSPEMMIAAGESALFTVLKDPGAGNQFVPVSGTAEMHEALANLMGSRGLISFNQRIVFIEGEDSSTDRAVYEAYYPPSQYNVSFVPAGNSSTVRKTAERVNLLLTSSVGFQTYFSIVDRDIPRAEDEAAVSGRLFRLPVYHVENFLLDDNLILDATKKLLGIGSTFKVSTDVEAELKRLVLEDRHLKPYTRAVLDAKIAEVARQAHDNVFKGDTTTTLTLPGFNDTEREAKSQLQSAIADGTWRQIVKGRDLIKAYCAAIGIKYEHFINLVLSEVKAPPKELAAIMDTILGV